MITTIFKVLIILGLHLIFYLMSYPQVEISDFHSANVNLINSQTGYSYYYTPKDIDHFGHFSEASSGKWFEEITKKDGQLILSGVYLSSLNICSNSDSGELKYWETARDINDEYILVEIEPTDKITILSYSLHHIWKLFLIVFIFLLASWRIDQVKGKKQIFVQISLLLIYLYYLGSVFYF